MTDSALRDVEALHTKIYDALMRQDDGHSGPFIALTKLVDALDALLARLEQVEEERDDYRDVNESVRVCANHTREVIDGDDCLVCSLEAAEARVKELEARNVELETEDIAHRLQIRDTELEGLQDHVRKLEDALREIERKNPRRFLNVSRYRASILRIARRALAPDTAPQDFQQCKDCAWDICWQSKSCRLKVDPDTAPQEPDVEYDPSTGHASTEYARGWRDAMNQENPPDTAEERE